MAITTLFHEHISVFLLGLVALFALNVGVRDSSSIVAPVVSARIMTHRQAFFVCSIFEFAGALFFGSAVAMTVGRKLFGSLSIEKSEMVLLLGSALATTLVWGAVSWRRSWPTSSNQALFAGLLGSGAVMLGSGKFDPHVLLGVLLVMIASPLLGFVAAMGVTYVIRYAGQWMTPRVQPISKKLSLGSFFFVSFMHGSNEGQIVMGLILMAMGLSAGVGEIPFALRLCVALVLGLGILLGGQRLFRRVAMNFYRIRPPQDVCAELTAAGVSYACATAGFPASSIQVITGSVMGAGVVQNHRAIRWHVAQDIAFGWLVTIPMVALCSGLLSGFVRWLMNGSL